MKDGDYMKHQCRTKERAHTHAQCVNPENRTLSSLLEGLSGNKAVCLSNSVHSIPSILKPHDSGLCRIKRTEIKKKYLP